MNNHEQASKQTNAPRAYNPADHLIKIRAKDGTIKDYYPATWRLYELNMRYPNANFRTEIVYMDIERSLVIVKCILYLGSGDLEMAERRTEAMKSGLIAQLDKLETAAKARCARDFGISTELAQDLQDELDEPVEVVASSPVAQLPKPEGEQPRPALDESVRNKLNDLYLRSKKLGRCTNDRQFVSYVRSVLQSPQLEMKAITLPQLSRVEDDLVTREMAKELAEVGA